MLGDTLPSWCNMCHYLTVFPDEPLLYSFFGKAWSVAQSKTSLTRHYLPTLSHRLSILSEEMRVQRDFLREETSSG